MYPSFGAVALSTMQPDAAAADRFSNGSSSSSPNKRKVLALLEDAKDAASALREELLMLSIHPLESKLCTSSQQAAGSQTANQQEQGTSAVQKVLDKSATLQGSSSLERIVQSQDGQPLSLEHSCGSSSLLTTEVNTEGGDSGERRASPRDLNTGILSLDSKPSQYSTVTDGMDSSTEAVVVTESNLATSTAQNSAPLPEVPVLPAIKTAREESGQSSHIRQDFMYIDGASPRVIQDTQRQISITSQQLSESVLLGSPMPDRLQNEATSRLHGSFTSSGPCTAIQLPSTDSLLHYQPQSTIDNSFCIEVQHSSQAAGTDKQQTAVSDQDLNNNPPGKTATISKQATHMLGMAPLRKQPSNLGPQKPAEVPQPTVTKFDVLERLQRANEVFHKAHPDQAGAAHVHVDKADVVQAAAGTAKPPAARSLYHKLLSQKSVGQPQHTHDKAGVDTQHLHLSISADMEENRNTTEGASGSQRQPHKPVHTTLKLTALMQAAGDISLNADIAADPISLGPQPSHASPVRQRPAVKQQQASKPMNAADKYLQMLEKANERKVLKSPRHPGQAGSGATAVQQKPQLPRSVSAGRQRQQRKPRVPSFNAHDKGDKGAAASKKQQDNGQSSKQPENIRPAPGATKPISKPTQHAGNVDAKNVTGRGKRVTAQVAAKKLEVSEKPQSKDSDLASTSWFVKEASPGLPVMFPLAGSSQLATDTSPWLTHTLVDPHRLNQREVSSTGTVKSDQGPQAILFSVGSAQKGQYQQPMKRSDGGSTGLPAPLLMHETVHINQGAADLGSPGTRMQRYALAAAELLAGRLPENMGRAARSPITPRHGNHGIESSEQSPMHVSLAVSNDYSVSSARKPFRAQQPELTPMSPDGRKSSRLIASHATDEDMPLSEMGLKMRKATQQLSDASDVNSSIAATIGASSDVRLGYVVNAMRRASTLPRSSPIRPPSFKSLNQSLASPAQSFKSPRKTSSPSAHTERASQQPAKYVPRYAACTSSFAAKASSKSPASYSRHSTPDTAGVAERASPRKAGSTATYGSVAYHTANSKWHSPLMTPRSKNSDTDVELDVVTKHPAQALAHEHHADEVVCSQQPIIPVAAGADVLETITRLEHLVEEGTIQAGSPRQLMSEILQQHADEVAALGLSPEQLLEGRPVSVGGAVVENSRMASELCSASFSHDMQSEPAALQLDTDSVVVQHSMDAPEQQVHGNAVIIEQQVTDVSAASNISGANTASVHESVGPSSSNQISATNGLSEAANSIQDASGETTLFSIPEMQASVVNSAQGQCIVADPAASPSTATTALYQSDMPNAMPFATMSAPPLQNCTQWHSTRSVLSTADVHVNVDGATGTPVKQNTGMSNSGRGQVFLRCLPAALTVQQLLGKVDQGLSVVCVDDLTDDSNSKDTGCGCLPGLRSKPSNPTASSPTGEKQASATLQGEDVVLTLKDSRSQSITNLKVASFDFRSQQRNLIIIVRGMQAKDKCVEVVTLRFLSAADHAAMVLGLNALMLQAGFSSGSNLPDLVHHMEWVPYHRVSEPL